MSPMFIKSFVLSNKCPCCKRSKKTGYSVCHKHLVAAKMRWRKWSQERRKVGKCCYCEKASYKGFLRCKTHADINKARINKWMAQHPNYSKMVWVKQKETYDAQGRCRYCKPHRKALKGKFKCWTCDIRHKLTRLGIKTPINISRADLQRLKVVHLSRKYS